jgi:hypothetical protein
MAIRIAIGRKRRFETIQALADKHGLGYMTLYKRLRRGLKPTEAVRMPVRKYLKTV